LIPLSFKKVIYLIQGDSDADKENNAKYVLSVARKLGAQIFLVWEDIREVYFFYCRSNLK
jgi:hypothetical protein